MKWQYITILSKVKNCTSDAIMKKLFGGSQKVTKEVIVNEAKEGEVVSLLIQ